MAESTYNVLFLCTGNSARSIVAEALLTRWGRGKFHAFSAGSHPKGAVHPLALELLSKHGLPTEGLRSKSWDEFAVQGAPQLDFVFTVCDNAAAEMCPVWPGQPMTAHWGVPDPAALEDYRAPLAFRDAYNRLDARVRLFISLPIAKLEGIKLKRRLEEIGRS